MLERESPRSGGPVFLALRRTLLACLTLWQMASLGEQLGEGAPMASQEDRGLQGQVHSCTTLCLQDKPSAESSTNPSKGNAPGTLLLPMRPHLLRPPPPPNWPGDHPPAHAPWRMTCAGHTPLRPASAAAGMVRWYEPLWVRWGSVPAVARASFRTPRAKCRRSEAGQFTAASLA